MASFSGRKIHELTVRQFIVEVLGFSTLTVNSLAESNLKCSYVCFPQYLVLLHKRLLC